METLSQVKKRLTAQTVEAYNACPYSYLSKDYFARFIFEPEAKPGDGEVQVDSDWRIVLPGDAQPLSERMARHLQEFLSERMALPLKIERLPPSKRDAIEKAVIIIDAGGGEEGVPESFTLSVTESRVRVVGRDAEGTRDGIVRLVDRIGTRGAPILSLGEQTFKPRVKVRLGVVPWLGAYRDLVFMGNNAVLLNTYFEGEEDLFALSLSDAIPELKVRRKPEILADLIRKVREAKLYGLKIYAQVNTRKKFPKNDPVFVAHPEIRGALTWKADGEYVLCTEHPLVQRYLTKSVEGIFREAPLDGLLFINGGESFYHCFMRSFGTPKGHTNCKRCEPLGAETVVANLSNRLLEAARKVNPKAEMIAWPYSAEHVWSADRYQEGFIQKLIPGAGVFTEIEKDEVVVKPEGVLKAIGDYSIDLIGPGGRALKQVAACKAAGVPIHIKSEPELGFEAPGLPSIPCLDRWADRAEALVSCEPDGAWVFPYFRPCLGTSSGEVFKFFWWEPVSPKEDILQDFAMRKVGKKAGPHLRKAWKHVSAAIDWSPEMPAYYTGPYYIGPAHPMCASPAAPLPKVFYGQFLFKGEATDAEGLRLRPVFVSSPTGNVPVFGRFYREMESLLRQAVDELEAAEPLVDEAHRLNFDAESSPIRWYYHTARAQANFYESCQLRDQLLGFAQQEDRTQEDSRKYRAMLERWKQVLVDERANAEQALPLVERDMRLDCYYGYDHSFPHAADMIRTKLELLDREINGVLPDIGKQCGF